MMLRCWQNHRKTGAIVLAAGFAWIVVTLAIIKHRSLLPEDQPGPPVTVPFDTRLQTGSDDIPLSKLSKAVGLWDPEQIHLAIAGPGSLFVSWATHNASVVLKGGEILRPDLNEIKSQVWWGLDADNLSSHASGNRTSYTSRYPNSTYVSGVFHHVKIEGLKADTVYYYRCGDDAKAVSKVFSFLSPKEIGPHSFPQQIGIIGDLGQTHNSSSTLAHLEANNPPVVWLVGDYAYSDNYTPEGEKTNPAGPYPQGYHNSYGPRWDAWGRFTETMFTKRPLQGLHGNHEIELDLDGNTFQAFTHRYKYPSEESGSPSKHFYSFDISGAHVIHLASYQEYSRQSQQYKWLEGDLQKFSRARTPWLIVNFHAPFYHNYIAHYKEANCFRLALEELLYKAGVDMIFSGHVHSYAASNKVFNYTVDDCGPHHVVIGDGGNIERLYTHWVDGWPESCPPPSSVECPTFEDGKFCPSEQPAWSAYREPSFGHGILTLEDDRHAIWEWHRNQDGNAVVAHRMKVVRNLKCSNQKKQ